MMNETPRTTNRAEAERLLGVAEKLLHSRDFNGARDFAILALEAEPLLEGSDQLLAVAEVLLSAEKRINNHHDWYSILQVGRRSNDHDLIKKQYRRLALLLHPDKNKYPFSDQAFKLVADAWGVLSDSDKKLLYDNELSLYSRVELSVSNKLPVRRSQRPGPKKASAARTNNVDINSNTGIEDQNQRVKLLSFWTMCPYCYILYEYPRVYENCCLRCQNCERAFHAALIPSLPPLVPGKEAYYCSWGVFPLGFVFGGAENGGKSATGGGFPNWMPPMFGMQQQQGGQKSGGTNGVGDAAAAAAAGLIISTLVTEKTTSPPFSTSAEEVVAATPAASRVWALGFRPRLPIAFRVFVRACLVSLDNGEEEEEAEPKKL